MTLRRSLLTLFLALTAVASALAQSDGLNLRFANGIAAIVEGKAITVDEVRREIGPYIQQLQSSARDEKDFNQKLEALQDDTIQQLIDRELMIKEFRKEKDGKEARHIPASYIDNQLADRLSEQFENDRSKFLAFLRARGTTIRDYRKEIEEDIIVNYMKGQQRKAQSLISPVRIETFYRENKDKFFQEDGVHLRLIQLSRTNGETDADLSAKSVAILARVKAGEKFEDLAKEFSSDSRRGKGGDWGWMKKSDLKKEFSEPLFTLKKNELSNLILLPEGGFLLFVEDRKYAGIQSIDEVRDQIERMLQQQMSRANTERWLERLRRNGYVKHY